MLTQGLKSNFEDVFSDFQSKLPGAMYVAVDMELTGVSMSGEPDTYDETVAERLDKMCRIAESHAPIQIGFTLVGQEAHELIASTYNFYAFPSQVPGCADPSFTCRASALKFNDQHNVDFNLWIRDGVPYMTREDERLYLSSLDHEDEDLPQKTGLLRLWKTLCDAHVPLVIHGPIDLFFLLACFETRTLPREPRKLSELVARCFPCVFDTSHLYDAIGGPSSTGRALTKFLEKAQRMYEDGVKDGIVEPREFRMSAATEETYGGGESSRAHEAGYDSLATARLYAYLMHIAPTEVYASTDQLFLYKSVEVLDLKQARVIGSVGSSVALTSEIQSKLSPTSSGSRGSSSSPVCADSDASTSVGEAQVCSAADWLLRSHSKTASMQALRADEIFRGVLKRYLPDKGFGFIECKQTKAQYGYDVFVHRDMCPSIEAAARWQTLEFMVAPNAGGKPQAVKILTELPEAHKWDDDSSETAATTVEDIADHRSDGDSCISSVPWVAEAEY